MTRDEALAIVKNWVADAPASSAVYRADPREFAVAAPPRPRPPHVFVRIAPRDARWIHLEPAITNARLTAARGGSHGSSQKRSP